MNGTEFLEVARVDVAAMLSQASDRGESEGAARYRAMLCRIEEAIQRHELKGVAA